jgi:hypothetical protein
MENKTPSGCMKSLGVVVMKNQWMIPYLDHAVPSTTESKI